MEISSPTAILRISVNVLRRLFGSAKKSRLGSSRKIAFLYFLQSPFWKLRITRSFFDSILNSSSHLTSIGRWSKVRSTRGVQLQNSAVRRFAFVKSRALKRLCSGDGSSGLECFADGAVKCCIPINTANISVSIVYNPLISSPLFFSFFFTLSPPSPSHHHHPPKSSHYMFPPQRVTPLIRRNPLNALYVCASPSVLDNITIRLATLDDLFHIRELLDGLVVAEQILRDVVQTLDYGVDEVCGGEGRALVWRHELFFEIYCK